jgi:hypothetical protein
MKSLRKMNINDIKNLSKFIEKLKKIILINLNIFKDIQN